MDENLKTTHTSNS